MNKFAAEFFAHEHSLGEILKFCEDLLEENEIFAPKLEARILVGHILKVSNLEMVSAPDLKFRPFQMQQIRELLNRRFEGETFGRIFGEVEFYGLPFKVTPQTLEPRADTGILIDRILQEQKKIKNSSVKILDLGTGTGAIIISLLKNLPDARGVGADIDKECLDTSRQNAKLNGVAKRVKFVQTDWADGIHGEFEIIVSNPPYIETQVIAELVPEVRNHDPELALDGGSDGLDAYRHILTQSCDKLTGDGKLFLEIGFDQAESIKKLAAKHNWKFCDLTKDYGGNDRVLVFRQ